MKTRVWVPFGLECWNYLYDWLYANLGWQGEGWDQELDNRIRHFDFDREEDATAFKLRFKL